MSKPVFLVGTDGQLERAQQLAARGELVSAELTLRNLVQAAPQTPQAWLMLSELAQHRGDAAQAQACLVRAEAAVGAGDPDLGLALADAKARQGNIVGSIASIEAVLAANPARHDAWLHMAEKLEWAGRPELAVRAAYQGLVRGRQAGMFLGRESTPTEWQDVITGVVASVNQAREAVVDAVVERQTAQWGRDDMRRFMRAAAVFLGRETCTPPNPHQAPKYFYFPGLPDGPYHDPFLHPWTQSLVDAWETIRDEGLQLLRTAGALEDFMGFKPGEQTEGYVSGTGPKPAWDAFFFYRHGKTYAENHQCAPKTAALLQAAELCHIRGQAPEVCFSVLQPGTHLLPHYGVTNARLVMHLPLIVPPDCALNVLDEGAHHWREGEPMMFDDSFQHEAWNRSDRPRMILLMDCWNPHLTPVERVAVRALIENISAFENLEPGTVAAALQAPAGSAA